MRKNPKSKRPEAERAAEHYCIKIAGCVLTVRAVRTKWQRQDLFASDCVGIRKDGTKVFIQATAGQDAAVTARRRKLEKIPWHPTDEVILLQLRQNQDPANGRRKLWFFRVMRYDHVFSKSWVTDENAIEVQKEWFKAYRVDVK